MRAGNDWGTWVARLRSPGVEDRRPPPSPPRDAVPGAAHSVPVVQGFDPGNNTSGVDTAQEVGT